MANDGWGGNGLQNGLLKTVQDERLSNMQFWLGNLDFLQTLLPYEIPSEIAFFPFSRSILSCYSIKLGNIFSTDKSFEQIHHETNTSP